MGAALYGLLRGANWSNKNCTEKISYLGLIVFVGYLALGGWIMGPSCTTSGYNRNNRGCKYFGNNDDWTRFCMVIVLVPDLLIIVGYCIFNQLLNVISTEVRSIPLEFLQV